MKSQRQVICINLTYTDETAFN